MAKKVAYLGMFTALAVICGYIEALIPFNFGIPGMKLGLANIITLISLYFFGKKESLTILILRIIIIGLLFGNVYGIIYSLCGGILSFIIMCLGKRINCFSMVGVSILGGVFHNIGQLLFACLTVSDIRIAFYLPVLIISGAITGLLIGIVSSLINNKYFLDNRTSIR